MPQGVRPLWFWIAHLPATSETSGLWPHAPAACDVARVLYDYLRFAGSTPRIVPNPPRGWRNRIRAGVPSLEEAGTRWTPIDILPYCACRGRACTAVLDLPPGRTAPAIIGLAAFRLAGSMPGDPLPFAAAPLARTFFRSQNRQRAVANLIKCRNGLKAQGQSVHAGRERRMAAGLARAEKPSAPAFRQGGNIAVKRRFMARKRTFDGGS